MTPKHYGLHVRRISREIAGEPSLVVQFRNPYTHEWLDYQRFGEMSDDYAYINADRCARNLAAERGIDGFGITKAA